MNEARRRVRLGTFADQQCLIQELEGPFRPEEQAGIERARMASSVLDVQQNGELARILERLPGGVQLSELMATRGPCPPSAAFEVGRRLYRQLKAEQLSHDGLSPDCIYVEDDGAVAIRGFGFEKVWRLQNGLRPVPDLEAMRSIVVALCPGARHTLSVLDTTARPPDDGLYSLLDLGAGAQGHAELMAWAHAPPRDAMAALDIAEPPLARPPTELLPFATAITAPSAGFGGGSTDLLGSKLGRYQLLRAVGSGTSGTVYEGRADHGGRVAVKVFHSGATRARSSREVRAAQSTRSPHVVRIYDHGTHEDRPYVVMEFIDGEDLGQLLAREGRLEPQRAAALFLELLQGLDAIHRAGTVHRDVKPANIVLSARGLVLTDFGIARPAEVDLTRMTRSGLLGTPRYMAPEQANSAHDAGPEADMYSAGVILYELISGLPPFQAQNLPDLLAAHAELLPALPPEAEGLGAIALQLLAKDPKLRPRAPDLIERLRRHSLTEPLPTLQVSAQRNHPWRRWQRTLVPLALSLMLVSAALLYRHRSLAPVGTPPELDRARPIVARPLVAEPLTSSTPPAPPSPELESATAGRASQRTRRPPLIRAGERAKGGGSLEQATPPAETKVGDPSSLEARLARAKARLSTVSQAIDPAKTERLEMHYLETRSRLRRAQTEGDLADVEERLRRLEEALQRELMPER